MLVGRCGGRGSGDRGLYGGRHPDKSKFWKEVGMGGGSTFWNFCRDLQPRARITVLLEPWSYVLRTNFLNLLRLDIFPICKWGLQYLPLLRSYIMKTKMGSKKHLINVNFLANLTFNLRCSPSPLGAAEGHLLRTWPGAFLCSQTLDAGVESPLGFLGGLSDRKSCTEARSCRNQAKSHGGGPKLPEGHQLTK